MFDLDQQQRRRATRARLQLASPCATASASCAQNCPVLATRTDTLCHRRPDASDHEVLPEVRCGSTSGHRSTQCSVGARTTADMRLPSMAERPLA